MANTSQSAVGGNSRQHPTLIELYLLSSHPKPKEEWENPIKTTCPVCQMACWIHDAARRAQQDTMTRAMCTGCISVERDKQARL